MRYKLMNDYRVDWPFWRADESVCRVGDPALPADIVAAARSWAAQFNVQFDVARGWPDRTIALAHEAEGERIFNEVKRLLPEDDVVFDYWEREYRTS